MSWTRKQFEADRERYQVDLDGYLKAGLPEGHPLVERSRRRIETVDRVLSDPTSYGLAEPDSEDPS